MVLFFLVFRAEGSFQQSSKRSDLHFKMHINIGNMVSACTWGKWFLCFLTKRICLSSTLEEFKLVISSGVLLECRRSAAGVVFGGRV